MHSPTSSRFRLSALLCVVGVAWIVSSCGSDSVEGYCAAPKSVAVVVAVRDASSGLPAADGAVGTLVGASVDDTLEHVDSLTVRGGDQTGTYTVTIAKAGYQSWSASNVRVSEQGTCGNVLPVSLTALLQPETP